jgi:cytoskeletal protein RodZ
MAGQDCAMSSLQNDPVRNLPLVKPPQPSEKRADGWQVAATAIAAVVIVSLFLWGINNQRDETTAGQQTATQATPQGGQEPQAQNQQPGNAAATTGQSSNDNPPQSGNAGQTSTQQPTNPGQNGQPTENSGQQAQPRGQ